MPNGREPINPRQDDQIESQPGHRQAKMGECLTNGGVYPSTPAPSRAAALFKRDAPQRSGAHQQGLLEDEYEGGWDGVARVTARRVEERFRQQLDRSASEESCMSETSIKSRAVRGYLLRNGAGRLGYALQCAVIGKKIG